MALHLHIAQPVKKLAEMISESSSAQALLGVENAEEAALRIHFGYAESEAYAGAYTNQQPKPVPRMLCSLLDFSSEKATNSSWTTNVDIEVSIECLTLTADLQRSLSERYMAFCERVEQVVDDLRDMAASGTRLNITAMSTTVEPSLCDPKITRANGAGEVWFCAFRVTAGG